MDNPLTLQEAKDQVASWVNGADRYNQNLQSHLDYATNEIMKILELYARSKWQEAIEADREGMKISMPTGECKAWDFVLWAKNHFESEKPEFKP